MPLVIKSIILSFQNFPHSTGIINIYWPGSSEYTGSFLQVILAHHLVWGHGNPLCIHAWSIHGQRSLAGYGPQVPKESDMPEVI